MKNTKADLLPEMMPALLADARAAGLDTSFTYIAGLDTTAQLEKFMTVMLPQVTLFPSIQIFQPHNRIMDRLLTPEAECLGYYFNARRVVENIMTDLDSSLTPELCGGVTGPCGLPSTPAAPWRDRPDEPGDRHR
ncbi:hypothetical protein [Fodinicola feengrottensis]|uniref:hypothetical protein n=1 Tax=Fodinicola feengrottensis TaxID=435914 RepID=UPI0013D21F5B|nr:hypothetical protein [Fodinicola feengrottensis]